jgi:hypothetical protein|nr:MAG TPA: Nucleolysin TIA-1 isoform p40 [Crassvirales sp.]
MEKYQTNMIEEHSGLVVRIQNLHNWIYSDKSNVDNKIEFANKCIQLAAMKKYEEALRARFENAGIVFQNGEYFEHVASIKVNVSEDSNEENGEQEQQQ